jgi:hypothetical protein
MYGAHAPFLIVCKSAMLVDDRELQSTLLGCPTLTKSKKKKLSK